MQNEIRDIINKNLPSAVGQQLAEELERLYKVEEQAKESGKTAENRRNRIVDLERTNEELAKENLNAVAFSESVREREVSVSQRENKIDVFEAQLKQKAAEQTLESVLDLVKIVFRNQTIKKQVMGSVPIAVEGGYPYGSTNPAPGTVLMGQQNLTETETIEES